MNKNLFTFMMILILSNIPCFCTQILNIDDQKQIFQEIQKGSWRQKEIASSNNNENREVVATYLIRTIKLHNNTTDPQTKEKQYAQYIKIMEHLPLIIDQSNSWDQNFWNQKYKTNYTYKEIFLGKGNSERDVDYYNTPRQQQIILNIRELLRFKNVFKNMIVHSNYQDDDIIRALSLSGTFCQLDKESGELTPAFSGMIIPGQRCNKKRTFRVHSCLHGVINEDLDDLYFIPYGINLSNDEGSANLQSAFKVKSVWRDSKGTIEVKQRDFSNKNEDYAYSVPDYVMIKIKSKSGLDENGKRLSELLIERQKNNIFENEELFPGFKIEQVISNNKIREFLPDFLGSEAQHSKAFKRFNLIGNAVEKYYAIGRPGDARLQLNDSGFAVVTNITDNKYPSPYRSSSNNPNFFIPIKFVKFDGEIGLDIPVTNGMSGGIIMKTFLKKNNEGILQRLARPIGTLWGSDRCFDFERHIINNLNSFINLIQD